MDFHTTNSLHKAKKTDQKTCLKKYISRFLLYAYYPFNFRGVLLDGIFNPQLQG